MVEEQKEKRCGRPCEVYSRVVGYFRPLAAWNKGKQSEFKDRRVFQVSWMTDEKS